MARAVTLRSLSLVVLWAGLAYGQDPPPLEPPATEPEAPRAGAAEPAKPAAPTAPAAATTPAPTTTPAPAPARPMLVVPGVTAPARRQWLRSVPRSLRRAPRRNDSRAAARGRSGAFVTVSAANRRIRRGCAAADPLAVVAAANPTHDRAARRRFQPRRPDQKAQHRARHAHPPTRKPAGQFT